ncbi:superfamily II DNA/RNA helicase [Kitasatospora sp. MAP12-15]|uniref:DEAD/DEAH box helicase n=1 Tax=unclassified Kitasatospora TaxID=2633591 RepID=UPI002475F3DF|nr:DEAD/DEAH box helicase [Kitasatospora sp. MAP12-44]MDH6109886.1 superfamily II DNA/RNA helicase [Kitasatospora sp. MAP12-44]
MTDQARRSTGSTGSTGRGRPRTGGSASGSRSSSGGFSDAQSRAGRSSGGLRGQSQGQSRGRGGSGQSRTPEAPADFAIPVGTPARPPAATFAELEMPKALLSALTREGVTEPFPIQSATLPDAIAGRDVLGRGRTGSGKTLAFGLAVLARTNGRRADARKPLALVLVPTRELAQQVTDALTPYATSVNLRIATVVGGMSITRQANALRRGAEILVATPGRLDDLINRQDVRLDQVSITVLDEADQMADMGFLPQVTKLLEQVEENGQRMLFSATLDRNVDRLVKRFLSDPVTHSVDPSQGAVTTMEHHVLHLEAADKASVTAHVASREGRVIMFVHTKHGADRLAKQLLASGVKAAALHGGKSQPQRNRTLDQFRDGNVTALIATNVAARGIHIDGLDLVVNVDPPIDHKDYLHRGGRTARAGESGTVVTLVLPEQRRDMTKLMSTAGIRPVTTKVRPGDAELSRITGARTPSGVAVTLAVVAAPAPAPSANRRPSGPRSTRPTDVDANGNPRRRRPKQRMGAGAGGGSGSGAPRQAAGFSGKASSGAAPGTGSKSGGNYGTGRQRRPAR